MAANFGTYEGHRILSQAMNDSLNRVVDIKQNKDANAKWQMEFDEKKINDDILRRVKLADIYKTERQTEVDKKVDNIKRQMYSDVNHDSPLYVDENGNIQQHPNASQIIQSWDEKSNYGNIMDMSMKMEGPTLSMTDIAGISEGSIDYSKHALINQMQALMGQDADTITAYLDKNPNLEIAFDKFYLSQGIARDPDNTTSGEMLVSYGKNAGTNIAGGGLPTDPTVDALEKHTSGDVLSGWGTFTHSPEYGSRVGSGAQNTGIYFRSDISDPSKTQNDNVELFISAIKNMKKLEQKTGGDATDDMMIRYGGGNNWSIGEYDKGSKNDYVDARINPKNGRPQIDINGKWVYLDTYNDEILDIFE